MAEKSATSPHSAVLKTLTFDLLLTPRPDVERQPQHVEDGGVQEVHQACGIEQPQTVRRPQNADDEIERLHLGSTLEGQKHLEQG